MPNPFEEVIQNLVRGVLSVSPAGSPAQTPLPSSLTGQRGWGSGVNPPLSTWPDIQQAVAAGARKGLASQGMQAMPLDYRSPLACGVPGMNAPGKPMPSLMNNVPRPQPVAHPALAPVPGAAGLGGMAGPPMPPLGNAPINRQDYYVAPPPTLPGSIGAHQSLAPNAFRANRNPPPVLGAVGLGGMAYLPVSPQLALPGPPRTPGPKERAAALYAELNKNEDNILRPAPGSDPRPDGGMNPNINESLRRDHRAMTMDGYVGAYAANDPMGLAPFTEHSTYILSNGKTMPGPTGHLGGIYGLPAPPGHGLFGWWDRLHGIKADAVSHAHLPSGKTEPTQEDTDRVDRYGMGLYTTGKDGTHYRAPHPWSLWKSLTYWPAYPPAE